MYWKLFPGLQCCYGLQQELQRIFCQTPALIEKAPRFGLIRLGLKGVCGQNQLPPDELYELWSDVEDELDRWDVMRSAAPLDAYVIWKQHSDSLTILSEYEKVALWGLGL